MGGTRVSRATFTKTENKLGLQITLPRNLYHRPENRLSKADLKKVNEKKALLKSLAENCKQLNYYEN